MEEESEEAATVIKRSQPALPRRIRDECASPGRTIQQKNLKVPCKGLSVGHSLCMAAPDSPHLLCLACLPDYLEQELRERYIVHRTLEDGQEGLIRAMVGGGGVLYREGLLRALPGLEIIAIFGPGYEGIPLAYCSNRGIRVTHTPSVLTEDVADAALALVIMTSRRLAEAGRYLHENRWPDGPFPPSTSLGGKNAGILGLGRIGKAVARRLEACGLRIGYTARSPKPGEMYPFFSSLIDLAMWCDFLVVTCAGGSLTRHLVDARVLRALGPEGILVNIARGSIVDETALVQALEKGTIRGAGLDVFEYEPLVPETLLKLPQVVLLPHVGSGTEETRKEMARVVCENLHSHFAGVFPPHLIPELRPPALGPDRSPIFPSPRRASGTQ